MMLLDWWKGSFVAQAPVPLLPATTGWPGFSAKCKATPAEVVVVPYKAIDGKVRLVDADGTPGDGWRATCKRVTLASCSGSPPSGASCWQRLDDGWRFTHSLQALNLPPPPGSDGGVVLFIVASSKDSFFKKVIEFMRLDWVGSAPESSDPATTLPIGASAKLPNDEQLLNAVKALDDENLKAASARWL